jgi:hypothetical protein
MQNLQTFENFHSNEFGIFYIRPVFPSGHKLEWLNYYKLSNIPHVSRLRIRDLSKKINQRNDIIVKMDSNIHPGCVTKSESIEEISNQVYNEFCDILGKENVRMVWGTGEMVFDKIKNSPSLHRLDNFPIVMEVGRLLDSSNLPGIFKV